MTAAPRLKADDFDRTHLRATLKPIREALVVKADGTLVVVDVLQINSLGGLLVDFGGTGPGAVRWIPKDWEAIP